MASEIITLQLGSQANYVAAHFWNLQDEVLGSNWGSLSECINQEVLLSWSEDRHGDSRYRPRTVVLDVSGALGGVSFSHDPAAATAAAAAAAVAAEAEPAGASWGGSLQVHQATPAAKSRFRLELEAAAASDAADEQQQAAQQAALEAAALLLQDQQQPQYWTDFLQVDLAPCSVLTLPAVWQGLSDRQGWGEPLDTSAARETAEGVVEQVRWWAEQCDMLQGLQVLADDLCGWGSLSWRILQDLRDQYSQQPIMYYSIQQQQQQQLGPQQGANSTRMTSQLLSRSISLAEISQLVSTYTPLAPPAGVANNLFQAAAVLATGVDTATLPLRCREARTAAGSVVGRMDMHSMTKLLAGPAANMAALSLQLPAGLIPGSTAAQQPTGLGHVGVWGPAGAAAAAAAAAEAGPVLDLVGSSSTPGNYQCTPGVHLTAQTCLAQSITLRGARMLPLGSLCPTSVAQQALEALLVQWRSLEGSVPSIHQSCVCPLPVAVPYSFPTWISPHLNAQGAAAAAAAVSNSTSSGGTSQESSPLVFKPGEGWVPAPSALSQLAAASGFEKLLHGSADNLQRLGASVGGQGRLREWGFSSADAVELAERLQHLAGLYASSDY